MQLEPNKAKRFKKGVPISAPAESTKLSNPREARLSRLLALVREEPAAVMQWMTSVYKYRVVMKSMIQGEPRVPGRH